MNLDNNELNVLIAEKIMGWKKFKRRWVDGSHAGYNDSWLDDQSVELSRIFPAFSSDISAAFEIVERLRSMGLIVEVASYPNDKTWLKSPYEGAKAREWTLQKTNLHYQCNISKQMPEFGNEWISWADECAETPAMAICLSALKASERK